MEDFPGAGSLSPDDVLNLYAPYDPGVPGLHTHARPADDTAPDIAKLYTPYALNADGSATRPKEAAGSFINRTWHSLFDMAAALPGEIAGVPGAVTEAVTGERRTGLPDLPELSLPTDAQGADAAARARLTAGYLAGATPQGLATIAVDAIPGSKLGDDGRGNPIVTLPDGSRHYTNKPGLSPNDMLGVAGQALTMLPFMKGARALAEVAGAGGRGVVPTLARSALSGGGAGAASLTSDAVAEAAGSGEGVDPVKAMYAAGSAAAAEPLIKAVQAVMPGVVGAYQRLFGSRSTPLADDAGKLTTAGAQVFKAAGVDVSGLTPEQLKAASDTLGRTAPELAAQGPTAPLPGTRAPAGPSTVARAVTSAKTGIPFTEGQLTGEPGQLATEDLLRHGSGDAATVMRLAKGQSDAAVDRNVADLIPGVGAGNAVPGEEDIGSRLKQLVQGHAGALDAATDAAYAHPKLDFLANPGGMWATGPSATFSSGASQEVMDRMKAIAGKFAIDSRLLPRAADAQQIISELITTPAEDMAPGVEGVAHMRPFNPDPAPMLRPFNVADADQTLRKLDAAYSAAQSNTDRAAIAQMRRGVYATIDNAQAAGTLSGDADVLTAWKQARAAAKAKFDFVAPDNDAAKGFVNNTLTGGTSGQAVLDDLLGRGNLGSNAATVPILDHLKDTVGDPGLDVARQAAARRMLLGTTERASQMDAGQLAYRIDDATTGRGKAVTQRLFDPSEVGAMQDTAAAQRVLQQSGKRSTAGTAYTNVDAAGRYIQRFPWLRWLYNPSEAGAARDVAAARLATAGALRPGSFRPPPGPLSPGQRGARAALPILGGLLGEDYGRE